MNVATIQGPENQITEKDIIISLLYQNFILVLVLITSLCCEICGEGIHETKGGKQSARERSIQAACSITFSLHVGDLVHKTVEKWHHASVFVRTVIQSSSTLH